MTAVETMAACEAQGVVVTLSPERRLSYHPLPSAAVLRALRLHRDEIIQTLSPGLDPDHSEVPVEAAYDPTRVAVRIEYEQDGSPVGFWVVPDQFAAATFDDEPAIRRCDIAALIDVGAGALRRALVALREFPGARVRSVGAGQEVRP